MSPPGVALRRATHALLIEPDLLLRVADDPLEALAKLLTGTPEAAVPGVVGPLPERVGGAIPPLPPATGDFATDLDAALAWWAALTVPLANGGDITPRFILVLDQAEQVDAMERRVARAEENRVRRPVVPALRHGWRRFIGLFALLTGVIDKATLPETLFIAAQTEARSVRVQLILGLHRMSALDFWPIDQTCLPTAFEVPPLSRIHEFREVLDGTCQAYGLRLEPMLRDLMAEESVRLADENLRFRAPSSRRVAHTPTAASVLPQLRAALQRMLTEWRRRFGEKAELSEQDQTLDGLGYAAFSPVAGSIDTLGETAWNEWRQALAISSRLDPRGYFEARLLEERCERRFGTLLAGLVDARGDSGEDLTLLDRDDPRASAEEQLANILRVHRIIATAPNSAHGPGPLRLSHRAVLEHWSRARNWMVAVGPRLDAKRDLDRLYGQVGGKAQAADWPAERIEAFADLALNWVGSDEGRDAELRAYLREGLVERLDPETVDARASSSLARLPYSALEDGDIPLAYGLINFL